MFYMLATFHNTLLFLKYTGTKKVSYLEFISGIYGGGAARAADEYRIQITGADHFEQNAGEKTLILGWWGAVGVFAGFDYSEHTGRLGFSPSIQIREEFLRKALINGFSPCNKGNNEIAVAFRPDFFVNYVQSLDQLHSFGTSAKDFKVLEEVSEQPIELNAELIQQVSKQRQVAVIQLNKKLRDTSFKARVLNAYVTNVLLAVYN